MMENVAQICKFDDTLEEITAAIEKMQEMHAKIMSIPDWPGKMPVGE